MVSTMATRHQKALSSSSSTRRAMAASLGWEGRRPGVTHRSHSQAACDRGGPLGPGGTCPTPLLNQAGVLGTCSETNVLFGAGDYTGDFQSNGDYLRAGALESCCLGVNPGPAISLLVDLEQVTQPL